MNKCVICGIRPAKINVCKSCERKEIQRDNASIKALVIITVIAAVFLISMKVA